jgi:hypothetical protein
MGEILIYYIYQNSTGLGHENLAVKVVAINIRR